MLVVDGVHKGYDALRVLEGVSFQAEPGEIVSLLGPNGAGKTTLMSIIAGLRIPDAGIVEIDGFNIVTQRRQAVQSVGIAPQETAVQLALTTRQNLTFYAELSGVPRSEVPRQVEWAIDVMELGEFADRTAVKLSGGERRRVHSAAAIVGRPPLLLLDEPTVGADVHTRQRLLEAVQELAASGSCVLYTTHYLPEVEELNARVLMLDGGRIIADGPLRQLLDRHASQAVEMSFDGPAPDVYHDRADILIVGSAIRATGERITEIAADLLSGLGEDAARLLSVEIIQGSLDSVYLTLTGRRYKEEAPTELTPSRAALAAALADR